MPKILPPEGSDMAYTLPELPRLLDLDWEGFVLDLPFYQNLAERSNSPVLELGVGTGRAAIPLARSGLDVWGLDISEPLLERARCNAGPELAERLTLLTRDMRDFDLDRQFGLIFVGFGGFHHLLTPAEQVACLRCVRRHLAPDGRFVCDLRALSASDWETGESVPLLHDWTRVLPETGETVIKLRSVRAEPARQVQRELHLYDVISNEGVTRRIVNEVDLRFTTPYEMEGLLGEAGLQLDQLYGDYDLEPYNDASEYLITIASIASKESA